MTVSLQQWAGQQVGAPEFELYPLAGDAGFRRYYRGSVANRNYVVMDAGQDRASCVPFARIARLLAAGGLQVPEVVACEPEQGWMVLTDLGRETFLDRLQCPRTETDQSLVDALYGDAFAALIKLQQIACPTDLPVYDEALLRRELELFPTWYLERHLRLDVGQRLRGQLDELFARLIDRALAQPRVLVHRDYMPRNLMISDPNPGVLDFQDAVCGPVSYDPVCLVKDAFISWPLAQVDRWLSDYWRQGRAAGLPLPEKWDDFRDDCDWMGAQRHLKVIGIFARICHRDGKPHYLQDVPRFVGYLREVAGRQPALEPLGDVLATVSPETHQ